MIDKNNLPTCPVCGNTADDGLDPDYGICDYCLDSPQRRQARIEAEQHGYYDNGRPMLRDDF